MIPLGDVLCVLSVRPLLYRLVLAPPSRSWLPVVQQCRFFFVSAVLAFSSFCKGHIYIINHRFSSFCLTILSSVRRFAMVASIINSQ